MMLIAMLGLLFVTDMVLIIAMVRLKNKQLASAEVIRELTEERGMLNDLRNQIRSELASAQQQARQLKDQMQVLATEAEQEVRQGVSEITREVESIIDNVSQRLDGPMKSLNEKQHYLVRLAKEAQKEREILSRVVSRAENIAKILKSSGSWEDVVDEIEAKRMADMRALLTKGVAPDKIARDLGIPEQQVRLVAETL
jgi:DNA anti-recombination protein RmuC